MKFITGLFIIVFLFTSYSSRSQTEVVVEQSKVVEKSGGKKYYLHTVLKGHTLFSIAKCYDVEVSDIVIENPDCLDGLSLGQVLRVPYRVKQDIDYPVFYNDHLLHKAKKGETFYSISKKYGVKVQELQDLNGTTLAIGQIVRINLESIKNKPAYNAYNRDSIPEELSELRKQELLDDSGKLYHTIKSGNTLFGIARLYGVGADEIIELNPKLNRGIKPGQVIEIPFNNHALIEPTIEFVDTVIVTESIDTSFKAKNKYNIAILLPFSLQSTTNVRNDFFDDNGNLDARAVVAFDFYMGAKIALDSLTKLGVKANVFTFDTERNATKVSEIISKPEFQQMDLIIGPLYSSYFKIVADFAKSHNIGIVAPMSKSPGILNDNKQTSKFVSSSSSQVRKMAKYVQSNFSNANILVVADADANTQTLCDKFYKQIYFSDTLKAIENVKQIDFTGNTYTVRSNLSQDKINVLFFPTNNAASVSRLLNDMSLRKNEEVVVIGTEKWESFNLQTEYLKKMQVHLLGSSKIDYSNNEVKYFVKKYRDSAKSEPSKFSFTGYDCTMAHVFWLHKKGVNFYHKLDKRVYKGLQSDILYRRALKSNGFENQSSIVLKFDDFEFKKINY